jgi:hypothetical protein
MEGGRSREINRNEVFVEKALQVLYRGSSEGGMSARYAQLLRTLPGGATPTFQRKAAYFCLSFARLSLAWLFALGRVLT